VDGDIAAVGNALNGAYGTLTLGADGRFVYNLNNALSVAQGLQFGETLTETFIYTVTDGKGATDTATLAITIDGRNDRPVGIVDSLATSVGTPLVIEASDLLANDIDADGDVPSIGSFTQARNGSVTLGPDAGLVYTPRAGFIGTDSFTYRPFDGTVSGASVRATVIVANNTAPVAAADG
jgi:VCBS repeat-containing protein